VVGERPFRILDKRPSSPKWRCIEHLLTSTFLGLDWNGIDVVDDTPPTMPFKQALESLFQNITIGFMSSKLLQYV